MKFWRITNTLNDMDMGIYEGTSQEEALDAYRVTNIEIEKFQVVEVPAILLGQDGRPLPEAVDTVSETFWWKQPGNEHLRCRARFVCVSGVVRRCEDSTYCRGLCHAHFDLRDEIADVSAIELDGIVLHVTAQKEGKL